MTASVPTTWPSDWPSVESIYRMALALTWDRGVAEELTDHAVETALTSPPASSKSPNGWFWRVLQNALTDRLRRGGSTAVDRLVRRSTKLELLPAKSLEEARERREAIESVLAAVRALNDEERSVIEARFFGGMSNEVVATKLGMPLRTVERRVNQALVRLRALLETERGGTRSALSVILCATPQRRVSLSFVAGNELLSMAATFCVAASIAIVSFLAVVTLRLDGVTPSPEHVPLVAIGMAEQPKAVLSAHQLEIHPVRFTPSQNIRRATQEYTQEDTRLAEARTLAIPAQAAESSWKIKFTLVVDGFPTTAWSAMEPLFEPDASRHAAAAPSRCTLRGTDQGHYSFGLPSTAGVWLLRFRDPTGRATLWVRVPVSGNQDMELAFELEEYSTPPFTPEKPREGIVVLRSFVTPGVWLVSSTPKGQSQMNAEPILAARGTARDYAIITSSYDPGAWSAAESQGNAK